MARTARPDAAGIGVLGFGEAGASIAAGLRGAGATVATWDVALGEPDARERIERRAREAGATTCDSIAELARRCDLVLSLVTCDVALDAAQDASAHLGQTHTFVDLNSTSPEVKRRIGETASASGAAFVEGAVMTAVAGVGHRVPILLCGEAAPRVIERLAPLGMRLEDVGRDIGRAAATKMFRSIVVKGLEALLLECVLASSRYGVTRRVLESVGEGYPGLDWYALADRLLGRTAAHGARRAHELDEVATTLRAMGIEPLMAEAGARRLAAAARALGDRFRDSPPADLDVIVRALEDAADTPS